MVAARIRGMARPHWMALYGAIIAAWATLYIMALPADLRAAGAIYGADFLRSLCVVSPDAAGYAGLVVMWLLMSAAMMAPTALPAFATYDELGSRAETRFGALVAGYLAVWGGFSVLAAGAQMALTQAGALTISATAARRRCRAAPDPRRALPVQRAEGGLPQQVPRAADLLHAALGRGGRSATACASARSASAAAGR
jgi:predicted metal-binding membrane protein